jgi:hypothetical protein
MIGIVDRRTILKAGGAAAVGSLAFTAPACPSAPTKEKAARVAGFIIDLSK